MPKNAKTKTTTETQSTTSKKSAKSTTKTAEAAVEVAAAPAPATSAVTTTQAENTEVDNIEVEAALNTASLEFLAKLNSISSSISALKNEYRALEKKWSKELKAALKASSKRKKKAGNRAPSGFVKPTRISDELAKFLSKPIGTEMARTEVTREINDYIRKNSLQDKTNGRKILADPPLMTLLKLNKDDELTYFNLQKFMSPHFSKNVKTEVKTESK